MVRTTNIRRSKSGNKPLKKGGWSTKPVYDPLKHPDIAYSFALLGYTNRELAERFGVSISTIEYWMANKPEFGDRVREGREIATLKVVGKLYESALGFYIEEEQVVQCKKTNFDANNQKVSEQIYYQTIKVKKYIKPETINQRYIMNNRTRHMDIPWGDNQNITVSGPNGGPIQHSLLNPKIDLSKHLDISELQFVKQIQEKVKEVQDE